MRYNYRDTAPIQHHYSTTPKWKPFPEWSPDNWTRLLPSVPNKQTKDQISKRGHCHSHDSSLVPFTQSACHSSLQFSPLLLLFTVMILVHKPQSHFPTFPAGQTLTHRRHPSAPVPALVAVQPTRTPGLLSLSKPQIQAQQKPRSSPKLKHKSPQPAHAVATLKPAPEIVEKQEVAKVSQSPKKRGRQPAPGPKPKSTPRSL